MCVCVWGVCPVVDNDLCMQMMNTPLPAFTRTGGDDGDDGRRGAARRTGGEVLVVRLR